MPRAPMDYSKSLIYKIVCRDLSIKDCYVGSTTDFRRRKSHHKSTCNNENGKDYNIPVYEFIRENGGWENWDMILVERYPCEDRLALLARERYFIEQLKASLNKIMPGRTKKEYYETNKEHIKKRVKEYRENNIEKIKEKGKEWTESNKERLKDYHKKYRENNKDEIKEKLKEYYEQNKERLKAQSKDYRESNKEQLKERKKEYYENNKKQINKRNKEYHENNKDKIKAYRENNKEEINKRKKVYREVNKQKIKEHSSKKIECCCGAIICKAALSRHRNSKKHKFYQNIYDFVMS